jgi:hypothetical protein
MILKSVISAINIKLLFVSLETTWPPSLENISYDIQLAI